MCSQKGESKEHLSEAQPQRGDAVAMKTATFCCFLKYYLQLKKKKKKEKIYTRNSVETPVIGLTVTPQHNLSFALCFSADSL